MKVRHTLFGIVLVATAALADISYSPVTPGATESAKKLYNFLATNYGSKTICGIQTGEITFSSGLNGQPDPQAVYSMSGKYPALVGFDFLFATGMKASDSWYKQYTNKTISLAIELWQRGGIPAFSWHWKDPGDSVDAFYTKGAGDPYTTFDFSPAFKSGTTEWDTSSATYLQMVSDIDELAAFFKVLQDSGVAAVFRPLHECGGTWFWWNTQSAAQYAALYRLLYTRITETDAIKNLVWVWNLQKEVFSQTDWDPGSTYYDVIGVDIYNPAYDYESNVSTFKSMNSRFGTNKILALTENGPIPDVSLMQADTALWSWYMPWYQSWSGKFVSKTKNTVWKANLGVSCVYTLDKMPGWDNYIISATKTAACSVDYNLGDIDTAVEAPTVVLDTSNGNGWMKVAVNNMHNEIDGNGDTTIHAAANFYIVPSTDLSGAKTASLTAYNTSLSGVWISLAVLTNETWKWEMPPDGKWLNAGDSLLCTFDVSAMSMDNIAKLYIMIATANYSGTIYFDNFTTDKGAVATFNHVSDLFLREGDGAVAYITDISLTGGGGSDSKIKYIVTPVAPRSVQIAVHGTTLLVSVDRTGICSCDIFDIQGHKVVNLNNGPITKGVHAFTLKKLSRGLYLMHVTGSFGVMDRKIILR